MLEKSLEEVYNVMLLTSNDNHFSLIMSFDVAVTSICFLSILDTGCSGNTSNNI